MEYPHFKVCIRCFTFNQSKYIADALKGFVIQQTDFPFVCCIVDDASTDGEQDVIREYVEENFDMDEQSCHIERETDYAFITYAQHKTNRNCHFAILYLKENHYSIRKPKMPYLTEWRDLCEYEALCEGDDYWTNPNKLNGQVKALDSKPSAIMSYTKVQKRNDSAEILTNEYIGKEIKGLSDLLKQNCIATLSVVYRIRCYNEYVKEIKPADKNWSLGDYPIWLYFAAKGDLIYIDKVTGVYRIHNGSASHPNDVNKLVKLINDANDIAIMFDQLYNNGKLTEYREMKRNRGLMTIYMNSGSHISLIHTCYRNIPNKNLSDVIKLAIAYIKTILSRTR